MLLALFLFLVAGLKQKKGRIDPAFFLDNVNYFSPILWGERHELENPSLELST